MKCPHCLKIIRTGETSTKRMVHRKELILKYLKEEVAMSKLYRTLRIHGYPAKHITFRKDIYELRNEKLIKLTTKRGCSTIIHPIKNDK